LNWNFEFQTSDFGKIYIQKYPFAMFLQHWGVRHGSTIQTLMLVGARIQITHCGSYLQL